MPASPPTNAPKHPAARGAATIDSHPDDRPLTADPHRAARDASIPTRLSADRRSPPRGTTHARFPPAMTLNQTNLVSDLSIRQRGVKEDRASRLLLTSRDIWYDLSRTEMYKR
jgi:hypothetical protein